MLYITFSIRSLFWDVQYGGVGGIGKVWEGLVQVFYIFVVGVYMWG